MHIICALEPFVRDGHSNVEVRVVSGHTGKKISFDKDLKVVMHGIISYNGIVKCYIVILSGLFSRVLYVIRVLYD